MASAPCVLQMVVFSFDYHIYSDYTPATAAISIPIWILRPSSRVWQLVVTPLFANSSYAATCGASILAEYARFRLSNAQVDSWPPIVTHHKRTLMPQS